jgi:hypothetical protein
MATFLDDEVEKTTTSSRSPSPSSTRKVTSKVFSKCPCGTGSSKGKTHTIETLARSTLEQPATKIAINERLGEGGYLHEHPKSNICWPTRNFTPQPMLHPLDAYMHLLNQEEIADMPLPAVQIHHCAPPTQQDGKQPMPAMGYAPPIPAYVTTLWRYGLRQEVSNMSFEERQKDAVVTEVEGGPRNNPKMRRDLVTKEDLEAQRVVEMEMAEKSHDEKGKLIS